MNKAERKSNFDMMRVLCIFLIIMHHYVTHGAYYFSEYIPQKLFYGATGIWGLTGVLGFIMVSSHFLYSHGSFSIQKVLRTVFETSFFSTGITIALYLPGLIEIGNSYILQCMFSVFTKQYWFITYYVIFYLLTPFLKLLCDHISIKNHRMLLIVFFIVAFPLNNIFHVEFLSRLGIFVYTYILVAYFIRVPDNFIQRHYKLLSTAVFSITTVAVCLAIYLNRSGNDINYSNRIYDISALSSTLMLLSAVCLYFIFKNLNVRYSKIWYFFGSSTLGIYLIHEGSLHYFLFNRILKRSAVYDMTYGPVIYIISCIGVLIGCALIYKFFEFILSKTVYDLSNKYLKRFYTAFDNRYVPKAVPDNAETSDAK